ncbi:MAG: TetR family transcriptional regulator [Chloroflexi bacterium]|nr:TetR family transcriptional regulator [Chloroflexota bacterium]MBV9131697.1 TetR family transcriptional regulator [Chloroflexota bacterium]MBV9896506.1 TetR family transcriptional regulator [Chloroflexota bacterium]
MSARVPPATPRAATLGSRVIAAATGVFRRVGYANASMDEIAREAVVRQAVSVLLIGVMNPGHLS